MKYVIVRFDGSDRTYEFSTNLNLAVGAMYSIVAEDGYAYNNPVWILEVNARPQFKVNHRLICRANYIKGLKRKKSGIKKVVFNRAKLTTAVLWADGTKTVIKCAADDEWDEEKALALCYVKRFFDNRGYYNDILKEELSAAERDYRKIPENFVEPVG